jgi:hypothetical protein
MVDEIKVVEPEVKDGEPEVVELSPLEQQAVQQGWVPKDEWKGDPDDWTPAKQFVKYGDLETELKRQKKETTHLNKVVSKMKDFYTSVKEDAKREVIDSLKRSKREAIADRDYEEVARIDGQIEDAEQSLHRAFVKGDAEVQKVAQEAPAPHPEFEPWNEKNRWYKIGGTDEASQFADTLALGYGAANPTKSYTEVLDHVTKVVKKTYPELFEPATRTRPAAVDDGGGEHVASGPKVKVKLTAEQKAVADAFDMSYEKYAEHLASYEKRKGF